MKQKIKDKFLVNSVLALNKARNEYAENSYFVSLVEGCVKTQEQYRLNIGDSNYTVTRDDVVYFDVVGSQVKDKSYLDFREWLKKSDDEKANYWTLNTDDYVIVIKRGTEAPEILHNPITQSEFDALASGVWDIRKITGVENIQSMTGDIVVRKIVLGV